MHRGIVPNRQETSWLPAMSLGDQVERGGSGGVMEGSTWVCVGAAGCKSISPVASVTSLVAFRLLATLKTLLSSACTTYSLPILTIE